MMGKLPLGVISPYVKMSSGGCTDPLNFYATSYSTAYGRDEFKPHRGSHKGTGYKSNLQPWVSYQPSLDALDNPAMGEQIRDTFQSVTSKSYGPWEGPDGRTPLPWSMHQTCSGYSRERPGMEPLTKETSREDTHFDTQKHGPKAISGLEPKAVPLLLQQQDRGSLEGENACYGPHSMTSEYSSKYLRELSTQQDLLQKRSIGVKERTGFTEGPLDIQPPSQVLPGCSVTKADFLPMTDTQGSDFLPVLALSSERETGYSRVSERMLDPRVSSPGPVPSSTTHRYFRPPRPMQQTSVALLGHQTVRSKKPTGFSLNNTSHFCSLCDPDQDSHYLSTYSQGFFKNMPKGLDWEGWTRGGVQPLKPSGSALNQGPTCLEPDPRVPESLQHPHKGRAPTPTDSFQAASYGCCYLVSR